MSESKNADTTTADGAVSGERPIRDSIQTPSASTGGSRPVRSQSIIGRIWALIRNTWRSLTSMRTALVLLFLLAIAAIPGALLPQRELNKQKTLQYIADHGLWGRILDKLQFFDVFESFWFTAVYVLLFVSLIGCILPRTWDQYKTIRARPVRTPRNLARLPHYVVKEISTAPAGAVSAAAMKASDLSGKTATELGDDIASRLRGWRKEVTTRDDGVVEISAEKGYFREVGNLVFHMALVMLLIAIGVGKVYGYEGTTEIVADGQPSSGFCNTTPNIYNSFRAGSLVDGTNLTPFCVRVEDFEADYLNNGQASQFRSKVKYQTTADLKNNVSTWRTTTVSVNHPLRIDGVRVYLLGHGYAPRFTVTFPNGERRTQTSIYTPEDSVSFLSSGVTRFDPPFGLYPKPQDRVQNQIALEGVFAPTAVVHQNLVMSTFPAPRNPMVGLRVYRGNLGLDTGRPQNVYQLDQSLVTSGAIRKEGAKNLKVGESMTIPGGVSVRFDGYEQWVSMQVSHDPAQDYVLVAAVLMMAGLLVSLLIKRRRVWVRITPSGADSAVRRTVVEFGGLAKTDHAGWGDKFDEMVAQLMGQDKTGS